MATSGTGISFSGLASGIDTSGIITKMTQYAQRPITQMQTKEQTYNTKLSAWQDINLKLASLQTSMSALALPGTFTATSANSSNSAVANITSVPGAAQGDHTITVDALAQAQKVVSKSLPSGNTALGQSGSFTLNGKTISLDASNTLGDIAVKINAAGAGASAAVVNVGPNDFRLTLTSTATGAANALSIADSNGGTLLTGLGILKDPATNPATIRQTITIATGQTGAGSLALSSPTQPVTTAMGLTSAPAGNIAINGSAPIAIDLNTDSLSSIAAKINGAGITGVTAQVVALPDANGTVSASSKQQLQILGASAPTFTDGGGALAALGVVQGAFGTPLVAAKDAQITVDGLALTRSSNTLNDVIPGANVKIQGTGSASLGISQGTDSIVSAVNNFVTAYNAAQDYIGAQNLFIAPAAGTTGTASTSPPLFGDSTLNNMQNDLTRAVGVVSGGSTLGSIGITLDTHNHLVVDTATLTNALQTNPTQVSRLFSLSGQSDNSGVAFVAAGIKTQGTTGSGYAVNITQPATQAVGTASVGRSDLATVSAAPETLTFGGALFSGGVSLTLAADSTLQDTVNQINSSGSLSGKIYAAIDSSDPANQKLKLSSLQYGAGNGFTVSSDSAADSTNSGLGASTTITDGQDVAGTINGEAATGKGRTLTGNAGNANTEGLQLLVSATSAGDYGHVTVTHGVADSLTSLVKGILDPDTGSLFGAEKTLNAQITDTEQQIQKMQDQVSAYTDYLQQMFTAMETRVSELQSQGSAFAAATGSNSTSKK
ncbi:MAG: flagellar filament capping protein FliD [Armatimonadota bacterium]|nr:flagellar filament capping protein FliD [Armatimonadota bacterium]